MWPGIELPEDLGLPVIGLAEEGIPQDPGDRGIARVKALADTPLGVVGEVLCVVAPPSPIIVPEVVERVVRGPDEEDRLIKDRCAHVRDVWVVTSGTQAIKKRRSVRKGAS